MFKQAIIYYPTNEKMLTQINKDIAAFHCAAAVKYMDSLNLSVNQKATLIDSLMQDIADNKNAETRNKKCSRKTQQVSA